MVKVAENRVIGLDVFPGDPKGGKLAEQTVSEDSARHRSNVILPLIRSSGLTSRRPELRSPAKSLKTKLKEFPQTLKAP